MSFSFRHVPAALGPGRRPPSRDRRRPDHVFDALEDAAIVAGYSKRPLTAIAAALDLPSQSVASRARTLATHGLVDPRKRFYHPRWTSAEIAFLQEHRGDLTDAALAHRLHRTVVGIQLKAKRLGATQRANFLTAGQVGEILSTRRKVVWLAEHGALRLTRSVVLAGNGNHAWRCEIEDLERFLRRKSEWYDWRRVKDEPWRGIARAANAKDPWLTVAEAARIVGLSDGGFTKYVRRGDVASVKIPCSGKHGYQYRVRRSALTGFAPRRPELVGHVGRGWRERKAS